MQRSLIHVISGNSFNQFWTKVILAALKGEREKLMVKCVVVNFWTKHFKYYLKMSHRFDKNRKFIWRWLWCRLLMWESYWRDTGAVSRNISCIYFGHYKYIYKNHRQIREKWLIDLHVILPREMFEPSCIFCVLSDTQIFLIYQIIASIFCCLSTKGKWGRNFARLSAVYCVKHRDKN